MRMGTKSIAPFVALLLLASSTMHVSPALAAPQATESRAQELGNYVRHRVGDMVDTVRHKVGMHWGNAQVESADAKIVGHDGKEIEYVRVRPAGNELHSGSGWMDRVKGWWPNGLRGGHANVGEEGTTKQKSSLYETAADIKNAAGETWDQAVQKAYDQWYATKRSSKESWDDAKKAAWDAWSATTDASQRTADAVTSKAKGATEATRDAALDAWHQTMAGAYHTWYDTKDKTQQNWKDAKNAAWKSWKATQGKAAQGYDFLTDSTSDAYDVAMQKAYDTWKTGSQKSGETWDAASNVFHRLYRSAATTSPEDALADAWDQWQVTKSETGETWDEAKKKAMDDYNRIRSAMGAENSHFRSSGLGGWEPWLRSTWHRWTSKRDSKMPSSQETWNSARDAAHKSYQAVSSLADQSWDQAREAARRAYYKATSTTKGDESWADAELKAWQRWVEARAYQGKANYADLRRAAESYWTDAKGKSREGYDDFMSSLWDAWSKARSAGGGTAEEIEAAAKDYYDGAKSSVKQTYDAISDAAWQTWLAATAQRGVTFEDIEDSIKNRWDHTKKRTKKTYKDFEEAARKTYNEAASSGEHSWLHNVSDAISCAWDDTKCRGISAWEGIKHTFNFDKGGGHGNLGALRDQAHHKVDELYGVAKAEL